MSVVHRLQSLRAGRAALVVPPKSAGLSEAKD
jgi:hypothetical protein